eukprot:12487502-Ditylum_brightwellii.AAC.1
MHINTRSNKGKQEIKAAVIAHIQQIGEPIIDHEPPSAISLTAVPSAHVAASPELSASSISRPPVHDTTSSTSSVSRPPAHESTSSTSSVSCPPVHESTSCPHVNASSAASETP